MRWIFAIFLYCVMAYGQVPIPRLTPAQKTEAQRLFAEVRSHVWGPYGAIQWHCKDGRILPVNTPCGGKGGYQYADPSAAARRLQAFNFDIARALADLPFETFFDEKRNHFFLREMITINYLTGRADGWIYAKTYSRRGVRQSEDEEPAARRLLAEMFSRKEWVARNYLLAVLVVANTPHGADTPRLREIRALTANLGDANPAFQPLRGKIHSKPESSDIARVEEFVKEKKPADTAGFEKLIQLMQAEYNEAASADAGSFEGGAARSLEIRRILTAPTAHKHDPVALVDELWNLQQRAFLHRFASKSRRENLKDIEILLKYSAGAGFLSIRELEALQREINSVLSEPRLDARRYSQGASYLEGSAQWARAAVLRELNEVQEHYGQVEPLASALIDDVLRSSSALTLASRTELLSGDADRLAGRRHQIGESSQRNGVRGLNPGIAIGKLDIIPADDPNFKILPDRIYVIPATLADLKPMKGILTLDSGNALSHAQLLAANLGIPNATVPSSMLPEFRKYVGQEVFYAVTQGGTVVVRPWDRLSASEQAQWRRSVTTRRRIALDTSRVNLNDRALKTLAETTSQDSGVRCGPKAANLGQLQRLFPENVAPGLVVPFGVYWSHVSKADARGNSLAPAIQAAYSEAEKLRAAGRPEQEILESIAPQLAAFRKAIRALPLDPAFVTDLRRKMTEVFGADGSYGVFVRSDTNAEDLPQFTGAGLNLTVPNVVGFEKILQALRDVWASPFEERAYAWRAQALTSSDRVYPSVVLYRTIRSDKSGVMATADLATLDTSGITVNMNEGVAAVVDGGVSESLLLQANGGVRLLAQARSAYRKLALPTGGFQEIPTSGSDWVLSDAEIGQLRKLASDVKARFPVQDPSAAGLPWDIECGFEAGQLRLFQIRPLVRYREAQILEALGSLDTPQRMTSSLVQPDRPLE